jgi:magnesium chelatase accessory protein
MEWEGWPNARASRFVDCRPHRWHLQEMGPGAETAQTILLIHGAGGAVVSFRDLMPDLARDFRVVAVDLPGHGMTRAGTRQRQGLDPMAEDLASLLAAERIVPAIVVGHSAGAAVALRLAQRLDPPPRGVVGINAALGHFKGVAGWLFPALAKLLALNPLTAHAFARLSSSEVSVRGLLRGTGSTADATMVRLYRRLVADPVHVDGTLAMMAQWDLRPLLAALPRIEVPVLLLTGDNDRAVPPDTSDRAARHLPHARVLHLAGLGHLVHEEAPDKVAVHIRAFAQEILGGAGTTTGRGGAPRPV